MKVSGFTTPLYECEYFTFNDYQSVDENQSPTATETFWNIDIKIGLPNPDIEANFTLFSIRF